MFAPLSDTIVTVDNILVLATYQDMLDCLKKVLDVLQEAKLTLKMSKCHFGFKRVSYLGFELSEHGIQPGEQK